MFKALLLCSIFLAISVHCYPVWLDGATTAQLTSYKGLLEEDANMTAAKKATKIAAWAKSEGGAIEKAYLAYEATSTTTTTTVATTTTTKSSGNPFLDSIG